MSLPVSEPPAAVTFLFTDIEGSTRLWEQQTERMRGALARHDEIARAAVHGCRGRLVKSTGDGIHAAFDDALDALQAVLQLQRALADAQATGGLPLAVRCGLHAGTEQLRDNDFFGPEVNRAARIMSVAHGGQVLLSQVVADAVAPRLPAGVALRDLGAVRLRDLSRPERLWQLLAPPLRGNFPALRSLEATPNNLAQQLNRFIGREALLPGLRALLARHRLLTLYGTGGIGKSRLAVQLAAELMDGYPDGVWFVELAPVVDGQRVVQAVASVLGLREAPGQSLDDTLDAFVRERRLLIILDNCEHVLAASAALAKRLLRAAAGLQLMATSREVLRVAGEASVPVPVLSAPDPAARASAESVMQHAAVRLFVDRASAVQPDFRVNEANAAAVAEICHRLDGIPLAIELAAARVRTLPVALMARRLVDSFRLVTTTDETVAPRQRTLHRLIDWSHDLLQPDEQRLFRRLSVFAGGWTLESAEAVCGGDGLDPEAIVELQSQLVEKSLVAPELELGRCRLLETVRQYAAEKCAAAGDGVVCERHRQHFLALAEQARPQLAGPEQAAWLARLDAERANLLAALAGCAQAGAAPDARAAAEQGLRMSYALRPYWIIRGLLTLGLGTTRAVLAQAGAQPRDALRARGLFDAGQLCCFMGRYAEAQQLLGECVAIARERGDTERLAAVLQPLGTAAMGLGDHAAARGHYEAAVAAARALDNPRQLGTAFNALAQLDRMEGRLDAAEANYQQSLALARSVGDPYLIAVVLLNLAMVVVSRADDEAARSMLQEVAQIADDNDSRPAALGAMDVSTGLAAHQGDWQRVAHYHGLTGAQYAQAGIQRDAPDEAFLEPMVERARQAMGGQAFDAAAEAARGAPFDPAWQALRGWLAGAPAAPDINRSRPADPAA